MKENVSKEIVGGSEKLNLAQGDAFLDLAEEIEGLIARRAYEVFEARGYAHGFDREDWLQAQSEILVDVPAYAIETETEVIARAEVPGLTQNNLEVRIAPRAICITGKRQVASNPNEQQAASSERPANRIFRLLDLPSEIDPEKASATLESGVLEIKMRKVGPGKISPIRGQAASA